VTNLIDVDCYWNKCTSMFLINDRDGNQNSVSMFFFVVFFVIVTV